MLSRLSLIPPHRDAEDDDVLKLHDGVSTDTREITIVASPQHSGGPVTPPEAPRDSVPEPTTGPRHPTLSVGLDELLGGGMPRRAADPQGPGERDPRGDDADLPERQPAKPKRSTVPSWDEIVFGTRRD
jgi:hypothetical protein